MEDSTNGYDGLAPSQKDKREPFDCTQGKQAPALQKMLQYYLVRNISQLI
jgi:hypothetical protein